MSSLLVLENLLAFVQARMMELYNRQCKKKKRQDALLTLTYLEKDLEKWARLSTFLKQQ